MDDGQFMLPHNICCDSTGRVYVADREAHRVQIFDLEGKFQTAWHNLHRACSLSMDDAKDGLVYCGELANQYKHIKGLPNVGPRVSVLNKKGEVLARLNNDKGSPVSHQFIIPHGIANDSQGNIFVADTQSWWAEQHPDVPPEPGIGTLKKLVRL
jgi:sugar lactone lactonase YvrE